jgi:hypothetical protein
MSVSIQASSERIEILEAFSEILDTRKARGQRQALSNLKRVAINLDFKLFASKAFVVLQVLLHLHI